MTKKIGTQDRVQSKLSIEKDFVNYSLPLPLLKQRIKRPLNSGVLALNSLNSSELSKSAYPCWDKGVQSKTSLRVSNKYIHIRALKSLKGPTPKRAFNLGGKNNE